MANTNDIWVFRPNYRINLFRPNPNSPPRHNSTSPQACITEIIISGHNTIFSNVFRCIGFLLKIRKETQTKIWGIVGQK